MQLGITVEGADTYTPEQQAYILKYAAGLIVGWVGEHVGNLITPDIGDGFDCVAHEQPNLFPEWEPEYDAGEEPLIWQAHGEVSGVIDAWFRTIARQAGFTGNDEEVWQAAVAAAPEGGKYPVMVPSHG